MVRFKVRSLTATKGTDRSRPPAESLDSRRVHPLHRSQQYAALRRARSFRCRKEQQADLGCPQAECDNALRRHGLGCRRRVAHRCVLRPTRSGGIWTERDETVKYYSPRTNVCIIRVAREPYRIAWAGVTMLTAIDGQRYIPNVVHVSGECPSLSRPRMHLSSYPIPI